MDQEETREVKPSLTEQLFNIYPQAVVWCYRAFALSSTARIFTEKQSRLLNRQVCYAQGFGLGGSGGVNAMIYTLGSSLVYDKQWAKEWGSDRITDLLNNLLKYYSPTPVSTSGNAERIIRAACGDSAAAHIKAATVMDNKSVVTDYYTSIHKHGTDRINQAHLCLTAERGCKGKLTVLSNCSVLKVQFDGNIATSLLVSRKFPTAHGYRWEQQSISPLDGGEIILCAGAFESPRILLASGLSAREVETEHQPTDEHFSASCPCTNTTEKLKHASAPPSAQQSIPNLVDIGRNLQDHCVIPYMLLGNWYSRWRHLHKVDTPYYAGKPAYPLNGVHGWVNLCEDGSVWSESADEPPT